MNANSNQDPNVNPERAAGDDDVGRTAHGALGRKRDGLQAG